MDKENSPPPSLPYTILQLLQSALTGGMTFDTLNHMLALLCLLSILQRMPQPQLYSPPPQPTATGSASTGDSLQKLLGQLTKSEGGGNDTLLQLLPLLNSPQLKSKMTPANMATIVGLLNTMGSAGEGKSDKNDKEKDSKKDAPAATVTAGSPNEDEENTAPEGIDLTQEHDLPKEHQRLEWKANF